MDGHEDHVDSAQSEWPAIPEDLGEWRPGVIRHPELWALVLESRGIPCRQVPRGRGTSVQVPPDRFQKALDELRLFEQENRNWPPSEPAATPLADNTVTTLSVLLLLATFHNLTLLHVSLLGHDPVNWTALGSADAGKIVDGEWWRTVTALTLHSGWLHLAGNLAIGGFFIVFLCRELGSGLAWSLLLASGITGNMINAFVQPRYHDSVGASTVVFGAVGILGAISLVRGRRRPRVRWALPIAAALGLLALLGTEGENTDIGAHLFGFVSGVPLGLAAEFLTGRYGRPRRKLNAALALASAVVVFAAWWMALTVGK